MTTEQRKNLDTLNTDLLNVDGEVSRDKSIKLMKVLKKDKFQSNLLRQEMQQSSILQFVPLNDFTCSKPNKRVKSEAFINSLSGFRGSSNPPAAFYPVYHKQVAQKVMGFQDMNREPQLTEAEKERANQ